MLTLSTNHLFILVHRNDFFLYELGSELFREIFPELTILLHGLLKFFVDREAGTLSGCDTYAERAEAAFCGMDEMVFRCRGNGGQSIAGSIRPFPLIRMKRHDASTTGASDLPPTNIFPCLHFDINTKPEHVAGRVRRDGTRHRRFGIARSLRSPQRLSGVAILTEQDFEV